MLHNFSFLDDYLAGSDKPTHMDDIEEYLAKGIHHIFCLTPNIPLVSKYITDEPIQIHHFPIYSTPDPSQITQFIEGMREIIASNDKAVVHCEYGQERTGIFLAAYLIEIGGMDINGAITKVRQVRSDSLRSAHAIHFLQEYYK